MTDDGSARVSVEGDVSGFARQTERDLDKELAKINLDPVKVQTEIDDASIAKTEAKAKVVGDTIGKTVNQSLKDVGIDPIDIKANPAEALAAIKATEEKLRAISDDAATVEIRVKTEKAISDLASFKKSIGESGKQSGRDLGDGIADGVDEKHGVISNALKKAFTPNAGAFDALKAPFVAALSTPIGAAVIAVAATVAVAFVSAFAAAIATAGLGAVFLGAGAAALFGAKAERDKAEADLTKAEEKVRKAELAAQSGTAASKRSLADAMAELAKAQEVVGKNAAFVKLDSSLKNLGDTLKRVGQTAAQPLIGPFANALDKLAKGAERVEPLLTKIFDGLSPAIGPLTDGIIGFVEEFLKVLTADPKTLEGMRDALIALGDNLPKVGQALGELFASLASNENNVRNIGMLFDILVFSIDTLGTALSFFSGVLDVLVGAWNAVKNAGSAVIGWITETAIPAITGAASAVVDFFAGLPDKVIGAMSGFADILGTFFTNVWDTTKAVVSSGVDAVVDFFTKLPERVRNAMSSLVSTVSSVFSSAATSAQNKATDLVNGAINVIRGLPGRIQSALNSVRTTVINAFSGAGSWLYNAGQNLIYGIGNGIWSALQWAVNAAWNAAQRIVQGFLDALRIGSPSKVMEDQVGKMIPAGIAEGIAANTGLVDKQIQDMIGSSFNIGLPTFTTPATAATRGTDGAALGQTTSTNPNLNVQVFVGDKEIKDVVRVAINEHDRSLGGQVSSGTGGFRV